MWGSLTHALRLDIWSMNINGGWPDSGNLIAGGPTDFGGGSDTILEIAVGSNTTP